jgi:hypothetical protein
MKKTLTFLILLSISFCTTAQENIFINSNAVNNPDSLENWLKANPEPNLARLRNLFKLEKNYMWSISSKSVIEEIGSLSKELNNKYGTTFYLLDNFLNKTVNFPSFFQGGATVATVAKF